MLNNPDLTEPQLEPPDMEQPATDPAKDQKFDESQVADTPKILLPEAIINGLNVIKNVVATLSDSPGVYRMLDTNQKVLYVGKAKNLKKRVVSYANVNNLTRRLMRMVSQTHSMEIVVTKTEIEALLLENNLIKKLQPTYNILLKDDKSFPYIVLLAGRVPRIARHRGAKQVEGAYFGPFANSAAVDETILAIQKIFKIRNCSDNIFTSRKRPCLQFHIKRCSAPCVKLIDETSYNESVTLAKEFLKGKSDFVQQQFSTKMHEAAHNRDYELASKYRDSIKLLTTIQTQMHQRINVTGIEDADVFALAILNGKASVHAFFFRNGQNYGSTNIALQHISDATASELMTAFLKQFFLSHKPASEILISEVIEDLKSLEDLVQKIHNCKVTIKTPLKGLRSELIAHAFENAKQSLERQATANMSHQNSWDQLSAYFNIEPLNIIEVYDNSHLQGSNPYGILVCASRNGFEKNKYRKFKIKGEMPEFGGNDVAMMHEVLKRRLKHVHEWPLPDLMLIDGGKPQLNAVLEELKLANLATNVIGISKGVQRNAGNESLHFSSGEIVKLPNNSGLLHFLQNMRDEAHRFAIGTHRAGRQAKLIKSAIDDIPGVGPKRKKLLLNYFGSAKAVAQASLEELVIISGIDQATAKKIYSFFHDQ